MTARDRRKRPLYMISVAAELAGVHPQTLRIYESRGILSPSRSSGNTRLYSDEDIERLQLVGDLTDEGINIAGVLRILDQSDEIIRLKSELETARRRMRKLEALVSEYQMRGAVTALAVVPRSLSITHLRKEEDLNADG